MQTLRSIQFVLFIGVTLLTGSGCDAIKNLRRTIHGDEQAAEAPAEGTGAGLTVTVEPPTGISILLDGIKVANASPYDSDALEPGTHTLVVRGMGYLPITLPVELKKHENLRVPIALLPRPVVHPPRAASDRNDLGGDGGGDGGDGGDGEDGDNAPPPRALRPPRPRAPPASLELPSGTAALEVQFVAQPANPVLLDGQRLESKMLRIHKQSGVLQVGTLTLPYAVTPARVLDLTIPNDEGSYNRDGAAMQPGTVIHLTHGATRIHRTGADAQAVILKRLD